MARLSQILVGHQLYCVEKDETVCEVACKMAEYKVGAILVLCNGELCGIFSERDLLARVVVEGKDPRTVRVGDVMTPSPKAIEDGATAEEAMELMQLHNCRHLPVLSDGKVVKMVSMRDLMYFDLDRKSEEIRHMREYIQGAAR